MNKQEAEKEAEKRNNEKWFCPIICNTCRHDCYSYYEAKAIEYASSRGNYYVQYPDCKCSMMVGVTQ